MELVKNENGKLLTSSLVIADKFNKLHKNVMRDIQNLECSDKFKSLNFELSEYTNSRGKKYSCYAITEKGFMFLAMGFTGKEAAQWKETFIAEFERMDGFIKQNTQSEVRLSESEILYLLDLIKCCYVKEFRDLAKDKHLSSYKPKFPKKKDHINASNQRNAICGINFSDIKERLSQVSSKRPKSVEAALIQVDKYELIRIATIDCFITFGKNREFSKRIGEMAKKIAFSSDEGSFTRSNDLFILPTAYTQIYLSLKK